MKDYIHKELEEIAPKLIGLKVENPFKVPDGYFESDMTDRILSKMDRDIPEGYFDSFSDRLMTKINADTKKENSTEKEVKRIRLFSPLSMGIAASLSILIMSMVFINQSKHDINSMSFEELKTTDMIAYIEAHESEFGEDIYNLIETNQHHDKVNIDEISDEELNEYLDKIEEDDFELLLN